MHNSAALSEIIACDSDFRISRDGTWFHQGSPIGRQAMVRLFSTILSRDGDGSYWLKTPVEKCRIEVEDVPFTIIAMRVRDLEDTGRTLCLKTNVNEWISVDGDHPLSLRKDAETGDLIPYVRVRDGLDARFSRSTYYELVEWLLEEGKTFDGLRGIESAGQFFPLDLR